MQLIPLLKILKTTAKKAKEASGSNVSKVQFPEILDKIIPQEYFGSLKNRLLFYAIVKKILTRSAFECIYSKLLYTNFQFEKIVWLEHLKYDDIQRRKYLALVSIFTKLQQIKIYHHNHFFPQMNKWLLEKIIKPLINRFYHPVRCGEAYEIKLFPKREYQRFQDKVFFKIRALGYLLPARDNDHPKGYLEFIPKGDMTEFERFRPLMKLRDKR